MKLKFSFGISMTGFLAFLFAFLAKNWNRLCVLFKIYTNNISYCGRKFYTWNFLKVKKFDFIEGMKWNENWNEKLKEMKWNEKKMKWMRIKFETSKKIKFETFETFQFAMKKKNKKKKIIS